MKIDESFRKIMERNHITEEQLSNMISDTIELAKKDLGYESASRTNVH